MRANRRIRLFCVCLVSAWLCNAAALADAHNPETDWMASSYGVGFHYLKRFLSGAKNGGSNEWNAAVDSFDATRFADDVAKTGAAWVLFTMGQNDGYYAAPCPVLNRYSGYQPGERCARRDLVMDVAKALQARHIRLMVYLPSNAPKDDDRIGHAFGLSTKDSNGNWHRNEAFVKKWAEVISDWSKHYGTLVSGWWFDGAYGSNGWQNAWGKYYRDAARAGNAHSIIALNPGASHFKKQSDYQDYIAGENGSVSQKCDGRWLDGMQCHTFMPFGGWGGGKVKRTDAEILDYTNHQLEVGGAVTWNLAIAANGKVDASHLAVFSRILGQIGRSGSFTGAYKILALHSGKALAVKDASSKNGALIVQQTYGGAATNDEWVLKPVTGGDYELTARHSGLALDVKGASGAQGADIIQWPYHDASNQRWTLVSAGGGAYKLVSRSSGKVLEVAGASNAEGARVQQATWTGAAAQKFQLISLP